MAGKKDGSLPDDESSKRRQRSALGTIALTLWGLALTCSAVDAILAFDRIRVLVFTGGLIMMDIAGAVTFSFFWFQVRHPPRPVLTPHDLAIYGKHLWHDGYETAIQEARAQTPNPRLIPTQDTGPIRGYYAAPDEHRANDVI